MKDSHWKLVSLVLIGLVVGYGASQVTNKLFSKDSQPSKKNVAAAQEEKTEPEPGKTEVSIDDDTVLGDPNAPITVVEFSDFQCSFCKRFFENTLPGFKTKYIDTGKVKLVYRDFPLNFHKQAQKAAETTECAGEQDKYWQMHDLIFQEQDSWVGNDKATDVFKGFAKQIGLNMSSFNNCLDNGQMAKEVEKDYRDGIAAGVSGTPTFFVNGEKLVGAQPLSSFEAIIEPMLQ